MAVERLWDQAIAAQQQRAAAHLLDHRFGLPDNWPGYHVARASVPFGAQDLVRGRPAAGSPVTKMGVGTQLTRTIREREFTACGGRLIGRPDLIRADEVVDYKCGAVLEYDAAAQADVVKAA